MVKIQSIHYSLDANEELEIYADSLRKQYVETQNEVNIRQLVFIHCLESHI